MPWNNKRTIRRTPDKYTQIFPLVRERIRIPQPDVRPIDIHARDLIKKPYVSTDPWWFTKHRRGIKRPKIGEDPLEQRAVPRSLVRGTLPERIMYNALINLVHLVAGVDFDFQSSQEGGRIELGGIVADFLFPYMKIVIQVQGPTHTGYLRMRKDEEQAEILSSMGYTTYGIDMEIIYDEQKFELWLRNLFNLGGIGGGSGGTWTEVSVSSSSSASRVLVEPSEDSEEHQEEYSQILNVINNIAQILAN